jgi:hypothetical protein
MRPADEREFSRVLAEATATNTPLELTGGASKREIGRPVNTAHSVSTKSLRGITLYESSEMVMSAVPRPDADEDADATGVASAGGARHHLGRRARRPPSPASS